jgi:hypothetical protein
MESRLHRSHVNLSFSRARIQSSGKELLGMDSALPLEASNVALQRLLVQQPVQQRRRKTANIGDTQRTPNPGMKHAEDVCERWRTSPGVSRMRYSHEIFAPLPRLKRCYKRLEEILFLGFGQIDSNSIAKLFALSTTQLHHCTHPHQAGRATCV